MAQDDAFSEDQWTSFTLIWQHASELSTVDITVSMLAMSINLTRHKLDFDHVNNALEEKDRHQYFLLLYFAI